MAWVWTPLSDASRWNASRTHGWLPAQGGVQELLKADAGHHHGYITSYPSMRMVAMKLARCSEDLHRCLCSYSYTIYVKVCC